MNTVVLFMLQGRTRVITDDDGEPYTWGSFHEAYQWVLENDSDHMGLSAAEKIMVVDLDTEETEVL